MELEKVLFLKKNLLYSILAQPQFWPSLSFPFSSALACYHTQPSLSLGPLLSLPRASTARAPHTA
jgi:hypothetical protein